MNICGLPTGNVAFQRSVNNLRLHFFYSHNKYGILFSPYFCSTFKYFRSHSFSRFFVLPIPLFPALLIPFSPLLERIYQNIFPLPVYPCCFPQTWHWSNVGIASCAAWPQMQWCHLAVDRRGWDHSKSAYYNAVWACSRCN